MPVSEQRAPLSGTRPALIASKLHLLVLLLIFSGTAVAGFVAQYHASTGDSPSAELAEHSNAVRIYLVALFMDWALFYYCYTGVRRGGGTLATLSAGRWNSPKEVLADVAIAIPFWALWVGVAYGVGYLLDVLNPGSAAAVESLLPKSLVEITLWILVCLTAGFCEEIAFRGYLQKQFHALTGSLTVAVILQGIAFGLAHAYQGWKNVIVIGALGILYGTLAAWRRNLRVNMISHAWSDVWGGWLKSVFLR